MFADRLPVCFSYPKRTGKVRHGQETSQTQQIRPHSYYGRQDCPPSDGRCTWTAQASASRANDALRTWAVLQPLQGGQTATIRIQGKGQRPIPAMGAKRAERLTIDDAAGRLRDFH
jgi:hypothetical protein